MDEINRLRRDESYDLIDMNDPEMIQKRAAKIIANDETEQWHFTKVIRVSASTCTSAISVEPAIVSFGDCNIGEHLSKSIRIFNLSDLATCLQPILVSKVI